MLLLYCPKKNSFQELLYSSSWLIRYQTNSIIFFFEDTSICLFSVFPNALCEKIIFLMCKCNHIINIFLTCSLLSFFTSLISNLCCFKSFSCDKLLFYWFFILCNLNRFASKSSHIFSALSQMLVLVCSTFSFIKWFISKHFFNCFMTDLICTPMLF